MKPMKGAVEAYEELSKVYDVYILSTAPWDNQRAWSDKLKWVKQYLPSAHKNLILSHNKHLNVGDYLIDDRLANGSNFFSGELLHFGTDYKDWSEVLSYLIKTD